MAQRAHRYFQYIKRFLSAVIVYDCYCVIKYSTAPLQLSRAAKEESAEN